MLILLCFLAIFKRKPEDICKISEPQDFSDYDSEGYNRQGYNEVGINRQNRYNRYYDTKCYNTELYSKEGFLDVRIHPIYLTNYARDRMKERMGVNESNKMDDLALEPINSARVSSGL